MYILGDLKVNNLNTFSPEYKTVSALKHDKSLFSMQLNIHSEISTFL